MSKVRKKRPEAGGFTVINPLAAGIDVSSKEMVVAVLENGEVKIRCFGSFTCDLEELVHYLKSKNIQTVAMESTGVYWIRLFIMLQEAEIEVALVNAQHVKNVTGKKTDESDAEWIMRLHSCGLLRGSFQPDEKIRTLRAYSRQRKNLTSNCTRLINRIHKSFEQMNIKLHTVISDIDGLSGTRIIEAIIAGERNVQILADLCDGRIKADKQTILKSLQGLWRPEYLFELEQNYELLKMNKKLIKDCNHKLEEQLQIILASRNEGVMPELPDVKKKRSTSKNRVNFNLTAYLKELSGVDVTKMDGISDETALTLISEIGTDLTKWPTSDQFCKWLNLVPNTKITGGKIMSSKMQKKKNSAGQALRIAAHSLAKSKSPLGEYYRRIKARSGGLQATVATARKMAIMYYHMMTRQEEYNPQLLIDHQNKQNLYRINKLEKVLAKLREAS
jgi:transposase